MQHYFSVGGFRGFWWLMLLFGGQWTAAAERGRIPFNDGWRFALRPAGSGFAAPDYADTAWARVALPHTWNALDGQDGGGDYIRGDGWYRKTFAADPAWTGRRVFVEFGAANRVAEVWLNGRRVGEHRGGYARFRFDLTDFLRRAGANVLAVRVNNETNGLIPLAGDFTFFGGLYREASLVVVPPAHLALNDHGSSGVYLTPAGLTAERGMVRVRVLLENAGEAAAAGEVRTVIRDAAGEVVAERTAPCRLESGRTTPVEQTLVVAAPRLWQGRADPYLYRATVELWQGGAAVDAVEQPLGFRTFAVDPQRGFFLNGRPYRLHGVNRHQDRLDLGYAISRREHREDFALIEEIGATAVRLAHYQQDDYAYQLADAAGLVVWAELAFVNNAVSPRPDFAANAEEQLRELIRQNYNHPAVLCWSIGNETTNEEEAAADPLLARLAAVAKEEDPGRPTAYASHHREEDPRNFRTDLLGYNRYFGWYDGAYEDFGPWLDAWHARHPDRPLGISEYGAGASIFQHDAPTAERTRALPPGGAWHPEEGQNDFHEHAWLALQARRYLWATFVWNMFDFASDGRGEGDMPGRNDKGLVTYDRRTRKDAFYWYKANWTDAPLVYLTSRRDTVRFEPVATVKIYSNCARVELWLNGASLGEHTSADRRFLWAGVRLQPGPNRLHAVGTKGGQQVTDSCTWTLTSGTRWRPEAEPAGK